MSLEMPELIDIESEQMTIAAILKDPETMHRISTIVSETDFYQREHVNLFIEAKNLYEQNKLDFGTLRQWLKENSLMAEVGGMEYIGQLRLSIPTLSLVDYYAEKVRDMAIKRRAMHVTRKIQQLTLEGTYETIDEYIAAVNAEFNNIDIAKKGNLVRVKDIVSSHIHQKLHGVVKKSPITGFLEIDKWMNGLGRNRLIVVAGRPGTGKTALSLKIARNVARQDFGPVPFFSMEMEKDELLDRMTSDITAVPFSGLQRCALIPNEKTVLSQAEEGMKSIDLFIDDTPRMDMAYITAQCRKLKREHGQLGLVVIDYLGLLELHQRKTETKTDAIGRVTKESKNLARELGCSVILLAQMNREIEKRSTKRPVLSDLRESGNIEQDADMVILLYKDDEKSTADMSHVDFIVAKGRQTGLADFELSFYGNIQRIVMR